MNVIHNMAKKGKVVKDCGKNEWAREKCRLVLVTTEEDAIKLLKGKHPRIQAILTPEEDELLIKRYLEAENILRLHQRPLSEITERL